MSLHSIVLSILSALQVAQVRRAFLLPLCVFLCALVLVQPMQIIQQRSCLERIWPDFQRCRERQREHFRYGRFSAGISFSSDVYQPKYRTECCSYWELLECVHKASKIYCSDEVDLKKLDSFAEIIGLSVPLYVCAEEYPKGSFRCKLPSWLLLAIFFAIFCFLVLLVLLFMCIRSSK